MSSVPFIPAPGNENNTFVTISASLSFAGCFFVLATYAWFKLTNEFHFKLICILSVVDLLISVVFVVGSRFGYLDPPGSRPYVCNTLDTILHFLFVSSFMWTACIAHLLLQVIKYEQEDVERFFKFYNLLSWGAPSIIVLVLVLRHVWWNADCAAVPNLNEYLIVRILFFVPLLLSWIFNIYAFIVVSKILYKEQLLYQRAFKLIVEPVGTPAIVRTQRLFLVTFAVCWIWSILMTFLEFFNVDNIDFLVNLNYIFTPLPGLFNSFIYGMNDGVKTKLLEFFRTYHCCHTFKHEAAKESLLAGGYDNEEFLHWRVEPDTTIQ